MSFINSFIGVFFLTGFTVGFGHCIGMCGPLVISYSLKKESAGNNWPHVLYNAGRVTTYTVLGGIMGFTGSFTMVTSRIAGIQKGVLILTGAVIILMGLEMSGFIRLSWFKGSSGLQNFLTRYFGKLIQAKSKGAYYPMGLLLGLLPCGPVYTAMIASARASMDAESILSGVIKGATLMTAYGLGTVPSLVLMGKAADLGWLKKRDVIIKVGSLLMIAVGVYFLIQGILY
jgi:sulfite exporter TauE/SafE